MKAVITGASGFIGSALSKHWVERGWEVVLPGRNLINHPGPELSNLLEGADIVVHLAGAPIISRWTSKRKKELYDSRILTTRNLADAIQSLKSPPRLFLSGSAIGIYDSEGIHSEAEGRLADDFLGLLCRDWEAEALKCPANTRVVLLRTGLVLGKDGGMLSRLIPVFRAGIGGEIASGQQGFSWIHISDWVRIIDYIIEHPAINGPVNMCVPVPIDNSEFTRILAKKLHRPAFFTVPAFALKMMFGQGSVALTKGQKVVPQKLLDAGFKFEFEDLSTALESIIGQ